LGHKGKGWQGRLADPLGISPHEAQYDEQQEMNARAAELEAQQAADAAAASTGPQAMATRDPYGAEAFNAAGVAGSSIVPRRSGRARRALGG